MPKYARLVDPITGAEARLPSKMTLDQMAAICVLLSGDPKGKPLDRLAAIRLYREIRGETLPSGEGQTHTLKVVVEGSK